MTYEKKIVVSSLFTYFSRKIVYRLCFAYISKRQKTIELRKYLDFVNRMLAASRFKNRAWERTC